MNRQQLHNKPGSAHLAEQIAQNALWGLLNAVGREIDHEAVIDRLACQVAAGDAVGAKDIHEVLHDLAGMLIKLVDASLSVAHRYTEARYDLQDLSSSRGGAGDTTGEEPSLPASVRELPPPMQAHVVRRHGRLSSHARGMSLLMNCPQVKARAEMEHVASAMVEEAMAKPPLVRLGNGEYETEIGEPE